MSETSVRETPARANWDEDQRDHVYTELCRALTAAGEERETLFLSKLCLLLIEELKSRDAALRAIAEAGR